MTIARLARVLRQRAASLFRPSRLDRDLDRELAFHLEASIAEKIADGMTAEAARIAARRELGNVAAFRDACRDQRRVSWWHDLSQDVRYGLRTLAAAPLFTAVAVVSLALGIGANVSVLALATSIQRDILPMADADRLVVIRGISEQNPGVLRGVSGADVQVWRARAVSFERIELAIASPRDLGDEGNDTPAERLSGQATTSGYLELHGAQTVLGRTFTELEAQDRARVVVLSHRLWLRRYGGDPAVVNRDIPVDSGRSTVIGVMAPAYSDRNPRVDFWTPMYIAPALAPTSSRMLSAVARLAPGVSAEQAERELAAISTQLALERPQTNAGWTVRLVPLREHLFGWARQPLANLQVAVALVLVMACANISSLLLARGTVRRREIAVRLALGAGRGRIVRQLLTETGLLAAGGGLLGLLIVWIGVHGLAALTPPIAGAHLRAPRVGVGTVSLIAVFAAATGVLCGLAQALVAAKPSPIASVRDPGPIVATTRGNTLRALLVTTQVALALILLIGLGLLTNSYLRLTYRELNFDATGLLTFEVRTAAPQRSLGRIDGQGYYELLTVPSQTMARIYERVNALPQVSSVGGISFPPVDSLILPVLNVRLDDRPGEEELSAAYFLVTPRFFETMRTPVVRGREISDQDTQSSSWVAVVNEAAARQFWPGADPIGQRLTITIVPEERSREVVGVVRDIPTRHGQIDPQPVIYASYLQQPNRYRGPFGVMFGQMLFVIRQPGDPLSLVPLVRQAVAEIERRPIAAVMTAEERGRLGRARTQYPLMLLGALTWTAVLLAAMGVYGLLAYAVSVRTREIGIRKALGARSRAIALFIGRQVGIVVVTGLAIGIVGATSATHLLASQLWGVTPTDLRTFGAVTLLLVVVAVVACIRPLRRALAVDPSIALRTE